MKGKSKRLQMRHEVSDQGKIDRVVQKSFTKEASHKVETSTWGDGFVSGLMRILSAIFGFNRRKKPQYHSGVSTKSYCQKFGGAFGGTLPKNIGNHGRGGVPYSKYMNGTVGHKLAKKLTVHIPSKGII